MGLLNNKIDKMNNDLPEISRVQMSEKLRLAPGHALPSRLRTLPQITHTK